MYVCLFNPCVPCLDGKLYNLYHITQVLRGCCKILYASCGYGLSSDTNVLTAKEMSEVLAHSIINFYHKLPNGPRINKYHRLNIYLSWKFGKHTYHDVLSRCLPTIESKVFPSDMLETLYWKWRRICYWTTKHK